MPPSIPASLLTEIQGLTERDRRAVLGALTPDERALVEAMVADGAPDAPMTAFSPWMAELWAAATHVLAGGSSTRLTPAAAEALIGPVKPATAATPDRGPSLLDGLWRAVPQGRR